MPLPIPRSALQVMKNFRTRQYEGLTNHLRLHGPLPTTAEAAVLLAASSPDVLNTVTEPSLVLPNPFITRKNPKTGNWHGPKYSLRRQADLVKKAKETGNLAMIPPGPKLFSLELRMRRLQAALSPTEAAVFAASQATVDKSGQKSNAVEDNSKIEKEQSRAKLQRSAIETQTRAPIFESKLRKRQDELAALEQELEQRQTQHDLDELTAFENREEEAELSERRKRQEEYSSLEARITAARSEVVRAGQSLHKAREDDEVTKMEQVQEQLWANPFWVGDAKKKVTKGEELGIRLYAGKKRMFKGHTWEKEKAKRLRRQSILLRDMDARIARYKSYYKKRRPNPLKPSRLSKPRKLPF